MINKRVIIIGAGPAGLTAAYELLRQGGISPIVLERSEHMGGISRTEVYKGNRIDIGGHRFFSKSDRVVEWWLDMLPLSPPGEAGAQASDAVMLLRSRRSRIFFLRKLFDYPLSLSRTTLMNLGLRRVLKIMLSYSRAKCFPIRNESNLEQFFINRFGLELYETFFKSYTEKVWGVPCDQISAAWGAQRIKGLSISRALLHILKKPFRKRSDVRQRDTETSLIEQFYYPNLGPGLMWQRCADRIREAGGQIECDMEVDRLIVSGNRVTGVQAVCRSTGERTTYEADYVISTMAIRDLVRAMTCEVPEAISQISEGLVYRDFITVGLLVNRLKLRDPAEPQALVRDNWIYIQEPDVKLGRLQIFNNWSPAMVADVSKVWLGLEYFCNEGDALWRQSDDAMIEQASEELSRIGMVASEDILDGAVIRQEKTYPAYFGSYGRFDELRNWLDGMENLFLIGRNGMHRYNNQDHSMLTAMSAASNIREGKMDKSNIWSVNAEQEYHEEKR